MSFGTGQNGLPPNTQMQLSGRTARGSARAAPSLAKLPPNHRMKLAGRGRRLATTTHNRTETGMGLLS